MEHEGDRFTPSKFDAMKKNQTCKGCASPSICRSYDYCNIVRRNLSSDEFPPIHTIELDDDWYEKHRYTETPLSQATVECLDLLKGAIGAIHLVEEWNGEPGVRWFKAYTNNWSLLAFLFQQDIPDVCADNCVFIQGGKLPYHLKGFIIDEIQIRFYGEDYPI